MHDFEQLWLDTLKDVDPMRHADLVRGGMLQQAARQAAEEAEELYEDVLNDLMTENRAPKGFEAASQHHFLLMQRAREVVADQLLPRDPETAAAEQLGRGYLDAFDEEIEDGDEDPSEGSSDDVPPHR